MSKEISSYFYESPKDYWSEPKVLKRVETVTSITGAVALMIFALLAEKFIGWRSIVSFNDFLVKMPITTLVIWSVLSISIVIECFAAIRHHKESSKSKDDQVKLQQFASHVHVPYDQKKLALMREGLSQLFGDETGSEKFPLPDTIARIVIGYSAGLLEGYSLKKIYKLDQTTVKEMHAHWQSQFGKDLDDLRDELVLMGLWAETVGKEINDGFQHVTHPLTRILLWETLTINEKVRIVIGLAMRDVSVYHKDGYGTSTLAPSDTRVIRRTGSGPHISTNTGFLNAIPLLLHTKEIYNGQVLEVGIRFAFATRLMSRNNLRAVQMFLNVFPSLYSEMGRLFERYHIDLDFHSSEDVVLEFIKKCTVAPNISPWRKPIEMFALLGWNRVLEELFSHNAMEVAKVIPQLLEKVVTGAKAKENPRQAPLTDFGVQAGVVHLLEPLRPYPLETLLTSGGDHAQTLALLLRLGFKPDATARELALTHGLTDLALLLQAK